MKKLYGLLIMLSLYAGYGMAVDSQSDQLVEAALTGDLAKVKSALASGADINYMNPEVPLTALMASAMNGHEQVVKFLITKKPDANKVGYEGMTALIMAVAAGKADIVKDILSLGNDIDTSKKDQNGLAAIDYAAKNPAILKLLSDYLDAKLHKEGIKLPSWSWSH